MLSSRPNILFCLADDASFPFMSAYGCTWVNTPAFDRIARNGLRFNRAYTPNAKCAPSRAALLTGRNSWQLKAAANHWCEFPAEFKTVTDALAESGYHVGYTGKGWAPGVALDADGKLRDLIGPVYNEKTLEPPTSCISTIDYAENFSEFLAQKPNDQPFYFWYGSNEPHRPYEYKSGSRTGNKLIGSIDEVPPYWPDDDIIREDMLDHAFALEYFDRHTQRMLDMLEEAGELDNTLVIITADNGMPFPRVKGQAYEHSNHMPMAISWPQGIQSPGRTVDSYASFIDIAPTLLEVAGIERDASGMAPIAGVTLTPLFESESNAPSRDFVLIGKERHDVGRPHDQGYPIRGIIKKDLLYVINFEPTRWPAGNPETGYPNTDGSPTKTVILEGRNSKTRHNYWERCFGFRPEEELYDVARDPACLHNLSEDSDYKEIKAQLKSELIDRLEKEGDPRIVADGSIFDRYPYADTELRNFYERFTAGELEVPFWFNASDVQPKE